MKNKEIKTESSMQERFDEYWNEHDGTHFYKNELLSFIQSEIDRAVAKERERIEKNLKQYGYYRYYEKMNIEIAQNQSQFNKLITKQ